MTISELKTRIYAQNVILYGNLTLETIASNYPNYLQPVKDYIVATFTVDQVNYAYSNKWISEESKQELIDKINGTSL